MQHRQGNPLRAVPSGNHLARPGGRQGPGDAGAMRDVVLVPIDGGADEVAGESAEAGLDGHAPTLAARCDTSGPRRARLGGGWPSQSGDIVPARNVAILALLGNNVLAVSTRRWHRYCFVGQDCYTQVDSCGSDSHPVRPTTAHPPLARGG